MFEKLFNASKCFLIYALIVMFGLPLSFLMGGINIKSAQAAERAKVTTVQETSTSASTPVEKPKTAKMVFIGEPAGLHRANTYVAGQSISLRVTLSIQPSSVWAKVGVLDPNFEEKIFFSAEGRSASGGQNQGQEDWFLQTPKLSDDLNIGSHLIKIFAQDIEGKVIQTEVKITLQQFTAVTGLSYKVSGDGRASIDWRPVNWAEAYLVNWQIQGDNASNKFETTKLHKFIIDNLESGTLYEVKIQPLRGDAVGLASSAVFKTLGTAPLKTVKGQVTETTTVQSPEKKKITPSIDGGVTTSKKVAESSPAPTEVTPTPTPSPTDSGEAKTAAGGWSKILIALSILIIAAGAAIGGYYGYEWLMLRSKDKEDREPPESSSRW